MVSMLELFVGTFFLAGFLAAFLLFGHRIKGSSQAVARSAINKEDSKVFTLSEVSKHNTDKDCWIIIKDKVYDVTPYVEEHPGGYAILNHAGGDSTKGFYGPQHASRVFDMVDEFYIGDLKS